MLRQFPKIDRDDFTKYIVCPRCYKCYEYGGHTNYRQLPSNTDNKQTNTDNKRKYFLKVFFRGYVFEIVKSNESVNGRLARNILTYTSILTCNSFVQFAHLLKSMIKFAHILRHIYHFNLVFWNLGTSLLWQLCLLCIQIQ